MNLSEQFDWGAVHDVANACKGKPVDQAAASVMEYLRQKHQIAMDVDLLTMAMSCITTGLENMQRGNQVKGANGINAGVEYVRARIEEARS